jgi:hypothetical protein
MRTNAEGRLEIRLQNPGTDTVIPGRTVHCVVVEEGAWTLPNGSKVEAHTVQSTITDRKPSWVGQQVDNSLAHTYSTAPTVVLGQVMSFNDPSWSAFWSRGKNRGSPPNDADSALWVGKHVGEDTNAERRDESIGYIVMDTTHGIDGDSGIEFETGLGEDLVQGYTQNPNNGFLYTFQQPFTASPAVAIVSQSAMDGTDGSWAILLRTSAGGIQVAVDEDMINDSERGHTTESLNYLVFSAEGAMTLDAV